MPVEQVDGYMDSANMLVTGGHLKLKELGFNLNETDIITEMQVHSPDKV